MAASARAVRDAIICCVGAVAMLLAWSLPSAAQGPPLRGEGSGYFTSITETATRDAGPNRIAERTLTGVLNQGPLDGTFVQHVRGVVHPNGQVNFQGTMEFTGTAEGCGEDPITVTARLNGKGSAGDVPVTDGRFALVGGSSVNGNGTVHQDGLSITYTVRYTCR